MEKRIALVSDVHTTNGKEGDQPLYHGRMERVIAGVNAAHVDVAVIAGDLTEHGTDAEFHSFQNQIKKLTVPVLLVPGNHDVGNKPLPGEAGAVTPERVQHYEKRFGPSFWSKVLAGVRFVGINSLLMGTGFDRERDQWSFLESELVKPISIPTVVVSHQPPYLKTIDEPGGTYWNIEPEPRARLMHLLAEGNVAAVLSGHIHYPLVNYAYGILFLTTPPAAFGLPHGKQPEGWTLVTIRTGPSVTGKSTPASYEFHYIPKDADSVPAQSR